MHSLNPRPTTIHAFVRAVLKTGKSGLAEEEFLPGSMLGQLVGQDSHYGNAYNIMNSII